MKKLHRVPDLVTKTAVAFHAIDRELDVASLACHRGQSKPQRIRAVLFDQNERVDDVALGLGHLLALFVAHHRVEVHFMKRHIAHKVDAHHDHPGHPKEDDVKARLQNRSRIKGLKRVRFFGPAQGRKRPERRAKPGVKHVLVLFELAMPEPCSWSIAWESCAIP